MLQFNDYSQANAIRVTTVRSIEKILSDVVSPEHAEKIVNVPRSYDVKKEFEDVFRYNAMFMVNVEEKVSDVIMKNVCIHRGAKVVMIAKIQK